MLTKNRLTCGYWEGNLVLDGARCDFYIYIGRYNKQSKSLSTINLPVVIGTELSSLTRRGVIYVCISENIINEVRSLPTIYSPVVIGRELPCLTGGV